MMKTQKRAVLSATAVLIVSACSRTDAVPMDSQLKQDLAAVSNGALELAPKAAQNQMVVSAIEGGPSSTPARASTPKRAQPKQVAKPVAPAPRPAERVAEHVVVAKAPVPEPVVQAPAPAAVPSVTVEPAPLPPLPRATTKPAPRQTGPYKTEAEIFRQMPWIKP